MSFSQRFCMKIFPASWAEDMRAESLTWFARCPCGFERSIWEIGGIRWKAKGTPRRMMDCPSCKQRTWHTVYRKPNP
jgi:hypothetical protein